MALTSVPSQQGDPWLALFKSARRLQLDEGWEDYTVSRERANEIIDYLILTENAPFMVMSGIMHDTLWLWLSPVAESLIFTNCPGLLGQPLSVTQGYYLSCESSKGPALDALETLQADVTRSAHIRALENRQFTAA